MLTCSELYFEQCIVYSLHSTANTMVLFKICDTVVSVQPAAALRVAFVSDAVSGRPRHGSLGLQGFYHLVTECDGR